MRSQASFLVFIKHKGAFTLLIQRLFLYLLCSLGGENSQELRHSLLFSSCTNSGKIYMKGKNRESAWSWYVLALCHCI